MAADVQTLIAQGEWRESDRAERWAGKPIAQVLGLDVDDKGQRARVKAVLKDLLADGTLAREERRDATRQMRTWIIPGTAQGHVAKSASGPEAEPAPVNAPLVQPSGALAHKGSQAVHRTSESPLGDHCSGAERARSVTVTKTSGAKASRGTTTATPGQTSTVPVASDGSEFL